ncbi:MAG: pantoate--beta-alanine ligase [Candidatus Marinimicrobia bacterium]|nr:pantoate--beta-alanine ligase [Candidatus Neomarinimicrobiota bacterium]
MKIISSLSEFLIWRESIETSTSIGFVPTMGALHDGHVALIKRSLNEADITVVSIFVNPKQFGENEDLNSYPRTIEKDSDLLGSVDVDVLFVPKYEDIYCDSIRSFSFEDLFSSQLEGKSRPDFFPGVVNVVSRLFNIVRPSLSFFGKKDAQQLIIISKMVDVGGFPIKIVPVETVREPSGLAMSSRNIYLSKTQRCPHLKFIKACCWLKNSYGVVRKSLK